VSHADDTHPAATSPERLAVLASGSGTILEAMLAAGVPVSLVVTDRDCRALSVGADAGIEVEELRRQSFRADFDREAYTAELVAMLRFHGIRWVAMAGFMTVLSSVAFDAFPRRIVNTHPSLLPAFPGAHAVRDALAFGVKVSGCTVHVATPAVDHGPILAQEAVPVLAGDDEASLHERIKAVERSLYPRVLLELLACPAP
jgi:phosphoribosylglycinamide formyltransferase-1